MREREVLEDYIGGGGLMQLSTVGVEGAPVVCTVWYVSAFRPDRLYFVSRTDREHSVNIRRNPVVAGAVVQQRPAELGLTARGTSFTGRAVELPGTGIDAVKEAFAAQWPRAAGLLEAMPDCASRMYEIAVDRWVLYDEENFRERPRREIAAR
ncbi:pyridoxamine 5'-phosphate oxidase family protein [Nocardia blacklockiae]|uniref:pyridoxamine 5'-phosphate oxidase family protein n=1 Tax=Nocardia blacklockiae TaxID=480036 RepID=UPI0018942B44|nr:pyridoxamine 5'-phosphate oxidase family protein [Nocardia blacklockiae]MBF6173686.1 pyridoxamine 5'-phosphate oxidase family protein [Nocardia blacklockiae]